MSETLFTTPGARVGGARTIARRLGRLVVEGQRLLAALRAMPAGAAPEGRAGRAEALLAEILRERLGPGLVMLETLAAEMVAESKSSPASSVASESIVEALADRLLESAALIESYRETWRAGGARARVPVSTALEAVRSQHLQPALATIAKLEHAWIRSPTTRLAPADVARARLFTRMRQLDEDLPLLARCLERMKAERAPHGSDRRARLAEARIAALEVYFEEQAPAFLAFLTAFVTSDEHSPRGLRLSREDARKRFSPLRPPTEGAP